MTIHGVTTYLWFDNEALEAAEFYTSLFPNSKIKNVSHYQAGAQKPEGTVLVAEFELFGREFAALNGGPQFPHSEAVSFQVACETQEEIDRIDEDIKSRGHQAILDILDKQMMLPANLKEHLRKKYTKELVEAKEIIHKKKYSMK